MQGIAPGPFLLPATGPAYAEAGGPSARFYFEGTGNRIGTAYFVSTLAPDLSTVRFARYSANFIPRNAPVIADVDDINENVGFWAPAAGFPHPAAGEHELRPVLRRRARGDVRGSGRDLRALPERRRAARRSAAIPDADLVMIYIEEPDGSGHQFTLTDPRQATDPRDPESIFWNQDRDKVGATTATSEFAYQQADRAVQDIMALVGPGTNVFVVSDHGMAPFHTAVNARNILRNAGLRRELSQLSIITSGSAVNVYVNLQGREAGGTVDAATYRTLVRQHRRCAFKCEGSEPGVQLLAPSRAASSPTSRSGRIAAARLGFCTSSVIGQDFGDVFAMLADRLQF